VGVVAITSGMALARFKPGRGALASLLGLWTLVSAFIHGLQSGAGLLVNNLVVGSLIGVAGFTAVRRENEPNKRIS
jgi:hypothetical protein